ncbi:hypothetical protein ACP70R_021769 [Stipagrostis hirtigluma subsp. patula]
MPDLSRADCRSCMGDIIEMMQQCSGRLSGTIQGLSCSFSYAVAAFYSGSPTLRLPPPVPAPAACTVISSDEATREEPSYAHREDARLQNLAKQRLWRQCVRCKHMIELAEDCYHMTCVCGYQFCYTWEKNGRTRKQPARACCGTNAVL